MKTKLVEKEKQEEVREIRIRLNKIKLGIRSLPGSTLIIQRFTEQTAEDMKTRSAGQRKPKKIYTAEYVQQEADSFRHLTSDGKDGVTSAMIKAAIVHVAPYVIPREQGGAKLVRGAIQVLGDVIPIKYSKMVYREDKMTDPSRIVKRPEYFDWSCMIEILYNVEQLSTDQIIELCRVAGFQAGLGSWRPGASAGGNHGMFEPVLMGG